MSFTTGHALLIGVGTYANAKHVNVPVTADDATAVWNVLTQPGSCGYPGEQVQLLVNEQATRQAILDGLDALAKSAGPEATVLIFFSGHGILLPGNVFALTTNDMRYADDTSIIAESVVTAPELLTRLRNLRARKVLCVLNACHSGGASPTTLDVSTPVRATLGVSVPTNVSSAILGTGAGRVIMTACQAHEVAYVGDGELTLFPGALVQALDGDGIPNRRGFIGAYDLYDRVYELVTQQEPRQQPELTVSKGVGPFPVALFQGDPSATLGVFDAPPLPTRSEALRTISSIESLRMLQDVLKNVPPTRSHTQTIGDNAQVGTAIAGDVQGNVTSIQGGVTGPVMSGSFQGPVHVGERKTTGVDFGSGNQLGNVSVSDIAGRDINKPTLNTGDTIEVGDITGSSGIAIGRGARSTVRNVNTDGGDYAEGNIDKRKGVFGGSFSGPVTGSVEGGNVNQGDQVTFSGNISGSNINVKSTLTDVVQTITNAPHGSSDQKAELQQLIAQLNDALQKLPAEKASDAEAIGRMAEQTVKEATAEKPNKTMVQITSEGLKAATANIAAVLPAVVDIASKIASAVMKFVS